LFALILFCFFIPFLNLVGWSGDFLRLHLADLLLNILSFLVDLHLVFIPGELVQFVNDGAFVLLLARVGQGTLLLERVGFPWEAFDVLLLQNFMV